MGAFVSLKEKENVSNCSTRSFQMLLNTVKTCV